MIINGDYPAVDLPSGTKSGLRESIKILDNIEDIGFIEFEIETLLETSCI